MGTTLMMYGSVQDQYILTSSITGGRKIKNNTCMANGLVRQEARRVSLMTGFGYTVQKH
jgi:hypothetical protein